MSKHKKSSPNFMCLTYFTWYFGYDIFLQLAHTLTINRDKLRRESRTH